MISRGGTERPQPGPKGRLTSSEEALAAHQVALLWVSAVLRLSGRSSEEFNGLISGAQPLFASVGREYESVAEKCSIEGSKMVLRKILMELTKGA